MCKERTMLSSQEVEYLRRNPRMKRLTFDGVNGLYSHPIYGAYSISQCIEKELIKHPVRSAPSVVVRVSDEQMMRHLRCVDGQGCGLF